MNIVISEKRLKFLSEANITSKKADLPTQTKRAIILGDYGFLQITPQFLKKEHLEKELSSHEREDILREFSDKIKKVIEFIDFLPRHLNPTGKNQYQQKEVNFLTFCLFNEFQSFGEIEQTKQLILTVKIPARKRIQNRYNTLILHQFFKKDIKVKQRLVGDSSPTEQDCIDYLEKII
ncbi:3479_t:CDS:2 [Entrophospora sp. SA101]|nr:371_t:CDS:2 [Entrophospora sp. SA101]CAJ0747240.1 3479_t:CDS:2 [Entrophospora sp. SA101]CAJ0842977.1 13694_t:CDS:2 [Entrophospora sp. SA101]